MTEAKNTMTIGADGEVMHSLHAGKSGTITVTLLKTSPVNKKLSLMYNAQSQSSALWGNNVIVRVTKSVATSLRRAACFPETTRLEQRQSRRDGPGCLTAAKLMNCWGVLTDGMQIKGVNYRANKLGVFDQLKVSRKLLPMLAGWCPIWKY
jgi:hypothetical protein